MISPTPIRTSLTSNCPQDTFHIQGPSRSNPTVCSRLIFTPQRYTLYFNQQVSSQELCQFGMHGCLCMCMYFTPLSFQLYQKPLIYLRKVPTTQRCSVWTWWTWKCLSSGLLLSLLFACTWTTLGWTTAQIPHFLLPETDDSLFPKPVLFLNHSFVIQMILKPEK